MLVAAKSVKKYLRSRLSLTQNCLNLSLEAMTSYEAKETPPKGMGISNRPVREDEDMSKRKYIRWDADGVEKIPPNEAEDIQAVADMINTIQKAQWNSHRHCYTGRS